MGVAMRQPNCVDCGAVIDWSKVRLGAYWCRPCDKVRIHRISANLRDIAGQPASEACDCIYCTEDAKAASEERRP
jgi:hypothetical protein